MNATILITSLMLLTGCMKAIKEAEQIIIEEIESDIAIEDLETAWE